MASVPVLSDDALRMVEQLDAFYAERGRDAAQVALLDALEIAVMRIAQKVGPFYDAPALSPVRRRQHPLRLEGWQWLLTDGYWIGFLPETAPPTVTACFHERSSGTGPVSRVRAEL